MTDNLKTDSIDSYQGSLLQHGPVNDRVYLMNINDERANELLDHVDKLVEENNYSKVFAKTPDNCADLFEERGYEKEAYIPSFYNPDTGCSFMSLFLSEDRKRPDNKNCIKSIQMNKTPEPVSLPADYSIVKCEEDHATGMAKIYEQIFETYPFPVQDPAYLAETMRSHVDYFSVIHNSRIIALSSAEMEKESETVEMTDFAVLPEYRGKSLARILLSEMEQEMRRINMRVAYTIARAAAPGINKSFAYNDYDFSGTLVKNTSICGSIEDMNVWHKEL